jgi:uncharacterized NAD(P)/FAD-binding protein YdhS
MTAIAIIGAGFSGTALAVQLVSRALTPLDVLLINRSGPMARGLAYGTNSASHILNVPAARMSLFPDRPDDFLRFAQTRDPALRPGDFVLRSLYGQYLETRLYDSVSTARPDVRLRHVPAQVTDLEARVDGVTLTLLSGEQLRVDVAVLATGNFSPATPAPLQAIQTDPRYIQDPWAPGALASVQQNAPVLLVGTGLTMFDVALELESRGHQGSMLALSRRGLLPQPHRDNANPPPSIELPASLREARCIRTLCAEVRGLVECFAQEGYDWRDTIAALRPVTPALWKQLPEKERARFLRHLVPYWEVHRHRAAPPVAARVDTLRADGRLAVVAGRLLDAQREGDLLRVTYRLRGEAYSSTLAIGHVVNCTGPQSDIKQLKESLFANLLHRGLLQPDPFGLGVLTDGHFAPLDARGTPVQRVRVIGPMLKADLFESTAVPELRVHAESLATALLAKAPMPSAAPLSI